jgi:hypothetical protein
MALKTCWWNDTEVDGSSSNSSLQHLGLQAGKSVTGNGYVHQVQFGRLVLI